MSETTEEEWTSYMAYEGEYVDVKPQCPSKRRVLEYFVKKVRESLKQLEDLMNSLEEGDALEEEMRVCPDCYGVVDKCCRIVNGEPELFQCCLCKEYFDPEMEELREKLNQRVTLRSADKKTTL